MDYITFMVLVVGCIMILEAARRLDLLVHVNRLIEKISNKSEAGIQDNSVSYKILLNPMDDPKWKPRIGAAINDKPFILFLVIILVLTILGGVLTFVADFSEAPILLMILAFSLAFHSGPDNISINERYLQIIVHQNPDELNGHDLKILAKNLNEYNSWPRTQLIFGGLFVLTYFLPSTYLFLLAVFILLAGLVYLGSKYSITKGIFGSNDA
jgi:hypothetical protein